MKSSILVVMLGIVLVSVSLAACSDPNATPLPPITIKVVAKDRKFEPNILSAKANRAVELILENQDTTPHSIVFEELDAKIPAVAPGQTGSVTFTPRKIRNYDTGGAYRFFSDVAGDRDAGMTGNLSVNP